MQEAYSRLHPLKSCIVTRERFKVRTIQSLGYFRKIENAPANFFTRVIFQYYMPSSDCIFRDDALMHTADL